MWVAHREGEDIYWRGKVGETFSFLYQRKSHIDFTSDWNFRCNVYDNNEAETSKGSFTFTNESTVDYLAIVGMCDLTVTATWTAGDRYNAPFIAYQGEEGSETELYVLENFIILPQDMVGD